MLIVDAIYTGLGRIGQMWPGEEVADIVCVGKALGGGLPLSAAMFLWPEFEALWDLGPEDVYTHTHVGSPLACAGALVVLDEVPFLLDRVVEAGERFEAAGWRGAGCCGRRRASATRPGARRAGRPVRRRRADPGDAAAHDHGRGDRRGARAARVSTRRAYGPRTLPGARRRTPGCSLAVLEGKPAAKERRARCGRAATRPSVEAVVRRQ